MRPPMPIAADPRGAPGFDYRLLHRVPATAVPQFLALEKRLQAAVQDFPGYRGESGPRYVGRIRGQAGQRTVHLYESILRFDGLQGFLQWMDSPIRRAMLQPAEQQGYGFEGSADWEGYSRWLALSVPGPVPLWKTNLLVLLVLYPTVMGLTMALHGLPWDFPAKLLLGNVCSVAITGWLLVPWASRLYGPWAEGRGPRWQRALALASIVGVLVALLQLFRSLPSTLW
ncbi:hypothetical protein [Vulcanococcus limneticus]|uniref:hypothetical protein n=1 Tax=Vulcanococcus limneticus TaxID=2170428 RepID=UPI00398BEA1D